MATPHHRRPSGSPKQKSTLHSRILRWYARHGRNLPWRRNRTPYRILISEVMLQQTQVSRVLEKFPVFIRRFPTLRHLAASKRAAVIRAWRGMGYNRRAVQLHRAAQAILFRHGGRIPQSPEALDALPGIGRYTAHAIACSSFGFPVPVVDTNVGRVLARLFPAHSDTWTLAQSLLPKRAKRAYEWNQALMDLGATICTARRPECSFCPVSALCPSAFRVKPTARKSPIEPGKGGIPNRIYRGRIVDALRNLNGRRFLTLKQMAAKAAPKVQMHRRWFLGLLEGLEKDGLVDLKKIRTTIRVSLKQ